MAAARGTPALTCSAMRAWFICPMTDATEPMSTAVVSSEHAATTRMSTFCSELVGRSIERPVIASDAHTNAHR